MILEAHCLMALPFRWVKKAIMFFRIEVAKRGYEIPLKLELQL